MDGDRLLSLWEGGPPYALDPATLETRGPEHCKELVTDLELAGYAL